jgi:membrane-associated phospholipid phosphatase
VAIDLEFYTDFADGAIMFPLGVAVPLVLGIFGQRRTALAWTAVIGSVWAVMLVLKLSGYTIATMFPVSAFSEIFLVTPSGHAASAAAIYGGLVGIMLSHPGTLLRRTVLAAIAVALVIGATRILLGVHSVSEVIVGAAVGVAGAAGVALAARDTVERRARLPVLAAITVIIVTFHGDHTSWEDPIHDAAVRIIQIWETHT